MIVQPVVLHSIEPASAKKHWVICDTTIPTWELKEEPPAHHPLNLHVRVPFGCCHWYYHVTESSPWQESGVHALVATCMFIVALFSTGSCKGLQARVVFHMGLERGQNRWWDDMQFLAVSPTSNHPACLCLWGGGTSYPSVDWPSWLFDILHWQKSGSICLPGLVGRLSYWSIWEPLPVFVCSSSSLEQWGCGVGIPWHRGGE